MGNSKHTPGPWKVEHLGTFSPRDGEGLVVRTRDHLHLRIVSQEVDVDVADLNCDENDDEAVEATYADANLISQAPALVDVLEELLPWAQGTHKSTLSDGTPCDCDRCEKIRRARGILEAVLLFHDGGQWDDGKAQRWRLLTDGAKDATTKTLCDRIRTVLRLAGRL